MTATRTRTKNPTQAELRQGVPLSGFESRVKRYLDGDLNALYG